MKTRLYPGAQTGFWKSLTTQGDEREVIRRSDVALATSEPDVNLSKTLSGMR